MRRHSPPSSPPATNTGAPAKPPRQTSGRSLQNPVSHPARPGAHSTSILMAELAHILTRRSGQEQVFCQTPSHAAKPRPRLVPATLSVLSCPRLKTAKNPARPTAYSPPAPSASPSPSPGAVLSLFRTIYPPPCPAGGHNQARLFRIKPQSPPRSPPGRKPIPRLRTGGGTDRPAAQTGFPDHPARQGWRD